MPLFVKRGWGDFTKDEHRYTRRKPVTLSLSKGSRFVILSEAKNLCFSPPFWYYTGTT